MADYRTLKMALLADTSKFTSGINKATKETKTFGDKIKGFAKGVGLAFAAAGAAVATFAVQLGIDAVKAAIADQKSQVLLAKTLQNTTKATKTQTAAVEKYITKLSLATGVSDDKLRPSLAKLLTATGSITKAQKLQALALDISAGTSKDLETVSLSLAKAYSGNLGSLTRLGIKLDAGTIASKDFDAAAKELNKTFGGQSAAAAETAQGKMERLTVAIEEVKESIGYALLPTLETFVDWLTTDGVEGVQTFIDVLQGKSGKTLQQALLSGKKDMDGLTYGSMSENQLAWANLATEVKNMGKAFGDLFKTLDLGNPEGNFNTMLNGLANMAKLIGFIAKGIETINSIGQINIADVFGNGTMPSGGLMQQWDNLFGGGKAAGGQVRTGMSYLVGENGPELFTPNGGGGHITPNHRMGGGVTVNVYGAADSRESARAIQRALSKIAANGGSQAGVLGFA